MKTTLFIFLCLLIITSGNVYSQQKVLEVRGILLDNNDNPVQFAHVINVRKNIACISDTSGKFRIVMVKSDTIRISCIGFESLVFSLNNRQIEEVDGTVYIGVLKMQTKVYDLQTINIYRERWKSFLYDYSQIEPKQEEPYKRQLEVWKQNLISTDELRQLTTAANGSGIPLNFNRKREKAIAKVNELRKQDELNKIADEKYNPSVVSQITGITEDEAKKFIRYYNLDRDFIIRKNDYDLYLIITQLYQEYKKIK